MIQPRSGAFSAFWIAAALLAPALVVPRIAQAQSLSRAQLSALND